METIREVIVTLRKIFFGNYLLIVDNLGLRSANPGDKVLWTFVVDSDDPVDHSINAEVRFNRASPFENDSAGQFYFYEGAPHLSNNVRDNAVGRNPWDFEGYKYTVIAHLLNGDQPQEDPHVLVLRTPII